MAGHNVFATKEKREVPSEEKVPIWMIEFTVKKAQN